MFSGFSRFALLIMLVGFLILTLTSIPAIADSDIEGLIARGDSLRRTGDYSRALKLYRMAISLSDRKNDLRNEADALRGIGVICYYQGNNGDALEYWRRA